MFSNVVSLLEDISRIYFPYIDENEDSYGHGIKYIVQSYITCSIYHSNDGISTIKNEQ